jgi:hypothetical protein
MHFGGKLRTACWSWDAGQRHGSRNGPAAKWGPFPSSCVRCVIEEREHSGFQVGLGHLSLCRIGQVEVTDKGTSANRSGRPEWGL